MVIRARLIERLETRANKMDMAYVKKAQSL